MKKNGFKSKNMDWDDDLKNAKAKIGSYNVIIENSEIDLYESFLQECIDNGIEVILIYSFEHIEGQKFVKNRQILFNFINNLSNKFNLYFVDYFNDEMCYKY